MEVSCTCEVVDTGHRDDRTIELKIRWRHKNFSVNSGPAPAGSPSSADLTSSQKESDQPSDSNDNPVYSDCIEYQDKKQSVGPLLLNRIQSHGHKDGRYWQQHETCSSDKGCCPPFESISPIQYPDEENRIQYQETPNARKDGVREYIGKRPRVVDVLALLGETQCNQPSKSKDGNQNAPSQENDDGSEPILFRCRFQILHADVSRSEATLNAPFRSTRIWSIRRPPICEVRHCR